MPYNIHAFTRPNIDGSYSMFLNAYDCFERQEESKRHEIIHIENGDYDHFGDSVNLIELKGHSL